MTRRPFALAAVFALALPAAAAVVHRADETAVQGDVVAMEKGVVTLATRGADGTTQRVQIPLEDVVEINFDPGAAVPAQPAGPVLAAAGAGPAAARPPRGGKQGVTARFFNAQFWKSEDPIRGIPGPEVPLRRGEPPPTWVAKVVVTGEPDATVDLPNLHNEYGNNSPHPDIKADGVSVAFTGRIKTRQAGDYTFVGETDDDHWLYVNGKLVSSDPGPHPARDARTGGRPDTVVPIKLAADSEYDFVFLVNERDRLFACTMKWIPPGGVEPEDIPEECLYAETGAPAAPANLTVAETTDTTVKLKFDDDATSELRYAVDRATDPQFLNPAPAGTVPINGTTFTDSNLRKGVTYYYRVRAVNFEGQSAPAVVAATPGVAPATPAPAVAAAPPRANRKGVSAHFYNAQFWKSPKPAGAAVGPGRTSGNPEPLPAQDTLIVIAAPDVDKILPTLSNFFGEDPPAEGLNKDSVSAAFSGRIRPKETGEYTFLCRSDDDHWLLVDGRLVCSDPGAHGARDPREGSRPDTVVPIKLEAGKDYDFLFLANEGLVDFTAVAQWVPPGKSEPEDIPEDCLFADSAPPAPPADLKVSATTATGVTLSFRDVATSEIRYQVDRATDAEFVNAVALAPAPINATAFADKDLAPGVTYYYRVRAVNFEGSSAPAVVAMRPGGGAGAGQPAVVALPGRAVEPPPVPRGDKKGVSAQYFNGQYWRGPSPIVAGVRIRDTFDPPVDPATPSVQAPVVVAANPDASTTLTTLNNNFGEASPHPGINANDVSAAFTGRIRPKETGDYTFVCSSDDDHWLFVNGKLVCSDPGPHSARDAREGAAPDSVVPIKLEAGKDYDFVFLVNEGARDFVCQAMWIPPGRTEPEEIPEDCLLAQTGPPAAPTDLRVAETSDTGVTLTFRDASTSEVRFSVERDLGPDFQNPAPAGSVPINGGKFVDKDLHKGVTYYYRVRAVNFDGRSAPAVVAATPGVPVAQQQAVAAAAARGVPGATVDGSATATPPPPAEKPDAEGFVRIFNGKDLTGWDGDPRLWSVQDGVLVGEANAENPVSNSFLIWTGGEVGDFELRFTFRLPTGNSGMSFRSKIIDAVSFAAALLEKNHVAVVPGNDSGFDTHVRLSFATSMEQIDKGIDRIGEFLRSLR